MIIPKLQVDHREVPFDSGSPNIPVDVLSEDFVASHTEMDIDEIKKFNAERDATSSQSDSESDPTWEPEDMESVNTLVRGLNITPDRRSNRSYVTKDAKERLAVLTQWTCPITKESPISNLQRVIEVAHVVSKSLKGEEVSHSPLS
jgi:hypothetical protein